MDIKDKPIGQKVTFCMQKVTYLAFASNKIYILDSFLTFFHFSSENSFLTTSLQASGFHMMYKN